MLIYIGMIYNTYCQSQRYVKGQISYKVYSEICSGFTGKFPVPVPPSSQFFSQSAVQGKTDIMSISLGLR